MTDRYLVVGGGIVGLATARALRGRAPSAQIQVLDKEAGPARHQSGRNSGVIHSGIYYRPGSDKAELCRRGAASMLAFAEGHGVSIKRTGKLIVAATDAQLPALEALYGRGISNGVPIALLDPEQARIHEPFVQCAGAIRVESTAITDYAAVCRALVSDLEAAGVEVRFGVTVRSIKSGPTSCLVETDDGDVAADVVVNCAGLYADRLAATDPAVAEQARNWRIVPFRGEYFELRPGRSYLVKGLIYPVPDPELPFLGVHLTRTIDGRVHAGPNAVLALGREGYRWRAMNPIELGQTLSYPGFWRLARHQYRTGIAEFARSTSRTRFARSVAELVPEISSADLVPAAAGVRAQALGRDGTLADDFLIISAARTVHLLNAPSPAATSALEIGDRIADRVIER
jgi:(S)-2-hydroxyglutarate dehydrogenase